MTIRLSRYIGEVSYAKPISPLYIDDLVEGHAGTYIIVDVDQCHSRLDEQRRDKAMVTFVQGTPVTAMEEEHQGRRPSGGRHRAMQIEGLLRSYAVAQVVDTRAALAGSRRAGGGAGQGVLKVKVLCITAICSAFMLTSFSPQVLP